MNVAVSKDGIEKSKPLSRFWPANMHVVGKALLWSLLRLLRGYPLVSCRDLARHVDERRQKTRCV